jgi:hypothetical protein
MNLSEQLGSLANKITSLEKTSYDTFNAFAYELRHTHVNLYQLGKTLDEIMNSLMVLGDRVEAFSGARDQELDQTRKNTNTQFNKIVDNIGKELARIEKQYKRP